MEVPTRVIKVKYQERLRRFNVRVTDDGIDLNVDGLSEKLLTLFNLTPDTELMLTYIDEDGDEVALVDDDDLRDVAKQALDPLRITVQLSSDKNGIQYSPSGSSTPLKSQCLQPPLQPCREILKTVPEPVYETVVKLSRDLAAKASSPTSGVNELIDYFSKVGLTYLAHYSGSQHASQAMIRSDVIYREAAARETQNLEPAKVEAGTLKAPSLTAPGLDDVALDSKSISVGQPVIAETKVTLDKVSEKEKAMAVKIGECHAKDELFARTSLLPPVEKTAWFIGRAMTRSDVTDSRAAARETKNLEPAKVDAATLKATSSTAPGFNDVALGSQSNSVGQPVIAESKVSWDKVNEKEKAMVGEIGECHAKDKPFARTSLFPPVEKTKWFIGQINRALTRSDVTDSWAVARDIKNLEPAKVDAAAPGFNDVAFGSQSISVGQPVIAESKGSWDKVSEKEKAMVGEIGECHAKDKPFARTSLFPPVEKTEWFIGQINKALTLSDVTDSRAVATDTKNLEPAKVDAATLKATSLTAPGFNDVALWSQSISVGKPVMAESKVAWDKVSEKEKAMVGKIGECHAKDKPFARTSLFPPVAETDWLIGQIGRASNSLTENTTNIRYPMLEPYPSNFRASNHINGDHVGGKIKSLFPESYGKSTSIWAPYRSTLRFPELCSGPSPMDVCPISRTPVANVSAFRSQPASKAITSSGCNSQNVDKFHLFHCGIFCDSCGVHPITGPRFKSKVKEEYDLCMICFTETGKPSDYIRIDHPVVYPHHVLHDSHARDMDPVSSQGCGFKVKSCLSKMDSCFVRDVNIADNTVMPPLTPFTKIWRLKNNGIVAWPKKTIIFWIGGDELSNELSVELEIPEAGLAINQELDVAVDCIAPELPGKYDSCWALVSPCGQRFGQHIWIRIEVVASVAVKALEYVRSFNLNGPPLSSCLNDPETTNVVPESIVESCQNQPVNNHSTSIESSSVPSPTAPVSHHLFDHLNVAPAFRSTSSDMLSDFIPLPDINLPAHKDDEMSFKWAHLEEDVSAMCEDSLFSDEVSETSDWGSILDELSDMGFDDLEMNKMLLTKNKGHIEHVIMELIAAERK